MKLKALVLVCAGLAAATPSLAADEAAMRSVIEANLSARMRFAKENINNGIAEMKAGDTVKGCADLRAGSDDLGKALELLDQDLELIKTDASLSEASRTEGLSKGQEAKAAVATTYNHLNDIIKQRCV